MKCTRPALPSGEGSPLTEHEWDARIPGRDGPDLLRIAQSILLSDTKRVQESDSKTEATALKSHRRGAGDRQSSRRMGQLRSAPNYSTLLHIATHSYRLLRITPYSYAFLHITPRSGTHPITEIVRSTVGVDVTRKAPRKDKFRCCARHVRRHESLSQNVT